MREERRVVTALFADVVGSTGLGEHLDPEDFRMLVAGAVERMGATIEEMGGSIEATAGDGVLGLYGAQTAREDDPERAVIAGLRMVERLDEYGAEIGAELEIEPVAIRAGIESGLAVLGERAAGSLVEHVASGDCLNTAARLQGAASNGSVLVGPLTFRLVESLFDWGEPKALELKGKAEPVVARHARAVVPAARRRAAGAHAPARLVGRDRELALAQEAVAEVLAGEGRILLVSGEAGIGKTRLLDEVRTLYERGGDAGRRWVEGHCVSYAEGEPYLPFREILADLLDLDARDPGARLRDQVAGLLGRERAATAAPVLASIAGLEVDADEASRLGALSQEALQHTIVEAVAAVIEGVAAQGPVAVVLDDLHWADPSSIRLLAALAPLAERVPVLFVLAMRPERDHAAWALRETAVGDHAPRTQALALDRLTPEAERALVAELIGEQTLPPEFEGRLLERAEGNPFYLEELVRSLVDVGVLVRAGDGLRFNREAPFELPGTIERVVLSRIDRLESRSRELLTTASVLGRRFELSLLRWITREQDVSAAALADLERLRLVEAEATGVAYRFRHPLIQQTAYNTLLRGRRAELHGQAAAAIEALTDELTDEHHPVLARHHSAAGNAEAAARHHALAGHAAERVYAMDEALRHFDAALEAAGKLDAQLAARQAPALSLARGRARVRMGDFAGGLSDLTAALEGANETRDRTLEMHALSDLGNAARVRGYEEAIGYQERALRAAEELGDAETQVSALSRLSLLESNRLRLDRALELGERALEIARDVGDEQVVTPALDCVKLAALQLGDLERLEATASEMITIQRRTGDLFFLQWALTEAASASLGRGRHDEALERIEEAGKVNRKAHDRMAQTMILEARSWIDRSRGEYGPMIDSIREASAIAEKLAMPEWIAWVEASHGSHLLELRAVEAAMPPLERALLAAEEVGTPNRLLRATSHLAWAWSLLGDEDAAMRALSQANRLLTEVTAPPGGAFLNGYHSYLAIGRTHLSLGDPDRAEPVLGGLSEAAENAGWHEALAYAKALLAPARDGDPQSARALLEEALAAAAKASAPGPAWEAHAALAELAAAKGAGADTGRHAAKARSIAERLAATVENTDLRRRFLEAVRPTPLASAGPLRRAR